MEGRYIQGSPVNNMHETRNRVMERDTCGNKRSHTIHNSSPRPNCKKNYALVAEEMEIAAPQCESTTSEPDTTAPGIPATPGGGHCIHCSTRSGRNNQNIQTPDTRCASTTIARENTTSENPHRNTMARNSLGKSQEELMDGSGKK
jgi:type IV secretory pathway VirJ component